MYEPRTSPQYVDVHPTHHSNEDLSITDIDTEDVETTEIEDETDTKTKTQLLLESKYRVQGIPEVLEEIEWIRKLDSEYKRRSLIKTDDEDEDDLKKEAERDDKELENNERETDQIESKHDTPKAPVDADTPTNDWVLVKKEDIPVTEDNETEPLESPKEKKTPKLKLKRKDSFGKPTKEEKQYEKALVANRYKDTALCIAKQETKDDIVRRKNSKTEKEIKRQNSKSKEKDDKVKRNSKTEEKEKGSSKTEDKDEKAKKKPEKSSKSPKPTKKEKKSPKLSKKDIKQEKKAKLKEGEIDNNDELTPTDLVPRHIESKSLSPKPTKKDMKKEKKSPKSPKKDIKQEKRAKLKEGEIDNNNELTPTDLVPKHVESKSQANKKPPKQSTVPQAQPATVSRIPVSQPKPTEKPSQDTKVSQPKPTEKPSQDTKVKSPGIQADIRKDQPVTVGHIPASSTVLQVPAAAGTQSQPSHVLYAPPCFTGESQPAPVVTPVVAGQPQAVTVPDSVRYVPPQDHSQPRRQNMVTRQENGRYVFTSQSTEQSQVPSQPQGMYRSLDRMSGGKGKSATQESAPFNATRGQAMYRSLDRGGKGKALRKEDIQAVPTSVKSAAHYVPKDNQSMQSANKDASFQSADSQSVRSYSSQASGQQSGLMVTIQPATMDSGENSLSRRARPAPVTALSSPAPSMASPHFYKPQIVTSPVPNSPSYQAPAARNVAPQSSAKSPIAQFTPQTPNSSGVNVTPRYGIPGTPIQVGGVPAVQSEEYRPGRVITSPKQPPQSGSPSSRVVIAAPSPRTAAAGSRLPRSNVNVVNVQQSSYGQLSPATRTRQNPPHGFSHTQQSPYTPQSSSNAIQTPTYTRTSPQVQQVTAVKATPVLQMTPPDHRRVRKLSQDSQYSQSSQGQFSVGSRNGRNSPAQGAYKHPKLPSSMGTSV